MHTRNSLLLYLLLIVGTGLLGPLQTAFAAEPGLEGVRLRGRVTAVQSDGVIPGAYDDMEQQTVSVRLQQGSQRGETVAVPNVITGQPYYDLLVKPGDTVVIQRLDTETGPPEYQLVDFARVTPLRTLALIFALSLVLIGGLKGLKALISLLVMGVVVVYVLLPLVLRGWNPVWVTVGISSAMTAFFLLFVGGVNRKTLGAVLGTVGGLLAAGLLALWIGRAAYLTGLSSGEAQMLQFHDASLDVQGLLFSGIVIGALGAILDVGMSVSSAMEQVKNSDPSISLTLLFQRGMAVGRDVLGTMANTLVLAYVGSSLPLLLLFQLYEASGTEILNLDLVATEVVRAMAGTVGLALAVPLTALIAGFLQTRKSPPSETAR